MSLKQYTIKRDITSGIPYLSVVSEVKLPGDKSFMRTSDDVELLLRDYYDVDALAEEECFLICVDNALRAIGICIVSHGTVNATMLSPREIYQRALLLGAVGIIVAHNHPSGKVVPSLYDKQATDRLRHAGELIGIPLLDHVIIGDTNFSFMKEGLLNDE